MRRRRTIRAAILLATLVAAQGCYTRVVDARGIGGDSEKLREQQEHEPRLRGVLTTTTEREKKPSSGVW
jgi:hypothetical protein